MFARARGSRPYSLCVVISKPSCSLNLVSYPEEFCDVHMRLQLRCVSLQRSPNLHSGFSPQHI